MKLQPQQLTQQLKRGQLSVLWIHGDDAFLRQQCRQDFIETLTKQGHTDITKITIDRQVDIEALWQATQSMSLFSSSTNILIECTSSPPEALTRWVSEYLDQPADGVMIAIITQRLNQNQQKSRWFQKVDKLGAHVPLWPPQRQELPGYLQKLAKELRLTLTQDTAQWLADCTEGNLFAAKQTLEKLSHQRSSQTISLETLQAQANTDSAHFDVYQWVDACLAGNTKRAINILSHLQTEQVEPTIAIWALSRDTHLLCQLHQSHAHNSQSLQRLGIWPKRQPLFQAALKRVNLTQCHRLITDMADCDLTIKGLQPGNIWQQLHNISIRLTNPNVQLASERHSTYNSNK